MKYKSDILPSHLSSVKNYRRMILELENDVKQAGDCLCSIEPIPHSREVLLTYKDSEDGNLYEVTFDLSGSERKQISRRRLRKS